MTDGTGSDRPTQDADIYPFTPPPPTPEEVAGVTALRLARRKRRLRRTAAGLAVVIGGGTGGAVAVLASGASAQPPKLTSASVTTTTQAGTGTTPYVPFPGQGRWGRGLGPMGPGTMMGGNVLHGTYTVKTSGGAYETVQVQTGTATAVSSGSIEVTSADGFVHSYTVSSSTLVEAGSAGITAVNKGDSVLVQATVSGNSTTAQRVVDLTQVKAQTSHWPGGPGMGGPGPLGGGPLGEGPFDGGPTPAA